MRVGIVHNSLNSCGGGERVCLCTIEALKELGHEVVLGTVEATDWDRVERLSGSVVKPDLELILLPFGFKLKMFGIYLRLLTLFMAGKFRKTCELTLNTHGDVLPIQADVIYMHFPTFALLKENPVNVKYGRSLFWRFYFAPFELLQRLLAKRFLQGTLLTNSGFSKNAIKRNTGRDALILYPPVDTESFMMCSNDAEDVVVTCGRYSPEKNFEEVVTIAKLTPHARFYIVGAGSGKISESYYRKLQGIAEGAANVDLIRDLPFRSMLELYGRAKVYLHTMRGEHFGISVIEGMAAGLVPIVHRSGGPWHDILQEKQGIHGFAYETPIEAASYINLLLNNADLRESIAERNRTYVHERFSREAFKEGLRRIVKRCRLSSRS